jgi:hypothetical protein
MEKRYYTALVTDPALNNEVIVFSVRERDPQGARRAIAQWYDDQGWPNEGIAIRLVSLREKHDVQFIGHATADKDVEAIRRLCEEVLHLASDEPTAAYAEKLRNLVTAFEIGKRVFHDRSADHS